MAAWIWCSMADTVPARAPPLSISPRPIGASSREARLRRRKARSAWNLHSLHGCGAGTRAFRVETRLDTLSGPAPMKYLLILLGGGAGSLARYVAGRDRKSTRLNSSHLGIS